MNRFTPTQIPSTQNHLIQPILVEKTLVFTAESNIFPQFFIEKRYKLIIFATDRTIVDK